jgi:hypothetical protein
MQAGWFTLQSIGCIPRGFGLDNAVGLTAPVGAATSSSRW